MIHIYNDDCKLYKINSKIDLVLVDLPYGQTACNWDKIIDLQRMWDMGFWFQNKSGPSHSVTAHGCLSATQWLTLQKRFWEGQVDF